MQVEGRQVFPQLVLFFQILKQNAQSVGNVLKTGQEIGDQLFLHDEALIFYNFPDQALQHFFQLLPRAALEHDLFHGL